MNRSFQVWTELKPRYSRRVGSYAVFLAVCLLGIGAAKAEVQVTVEHNTDADATPSFRFKNIPKPSKGDAAVKADFRIVDGEADSNSGELTVLHDDKVATDEDQPQSAFFFKAGSPGGRLVLDLQSVIEIGRVGTYSWHSDSRAPQVYRLYGSDGAATGFDAAPKKGVDPESSGWKKIASVDARSKDAGAIVGGQYGVNIADPSGPVGKYRYLLFDISTTEDRNPFGNTFYTEIDVTDRNASTAAQELPDVAEAGKKTIEFDGGKYRFVLDVAETPELSEWADKTLTPAITEWYPKIVKMLPSEGYEAPKSFVVLFSKDMQGVAATGGTRVRCAAKWFDQNLKGEAVGAVLHELVHVVQQYGRARRTNPNATRSPGWLVEGIPDYIRWFITEPQTHGAEITERNIGRARYDGSYRITANFLNWVVQKYDPKIVERLNAAMREGRYEEALWEKYTGKSAQDLGAEWKAENEKRLGVAKPAV